MHIRTAHMSELKELLRIFNTGRAFMRAHGNHAQWINGYPSAALLASDIEKQQLFVCESDGRLCGAFAFILGDDPTYRIIEQGAWTNQDPYGTIHRIASDGTQKGVLKQAVAFALEHCSNLRADTHADNTVMQQALKKLGFQYCGIIHVEDGSPRLAFQYTKTAAD